MAPDHTTTWRTYPNVHQILYDSFIWKRVIFCLWGLFICRHIGLLSFETQFLFGKNPSMMLNLSGIASSSSFKTSFSLRVIFQNVKWPCKRLLPCPVDLLFSRRWFGCALRPTHLARFRKSNGYLKAKLCEIVFERFWIS